MNHGTHINEAGVTTCDGCNRAVGSNYSMCICADGDGTRNRQEALKRAKRAAYQRERYQAMRSLGLKKTPYGWE